jgi:hypothetical protein
MRKHQIIRDLEDRLQCRECREQYATMEEIKDYDCRPGWTEWILAALLVVAGVGGFALMYLK